MLTSIFTDLELEPDPLVTDHCGNCTECLDSLDLIAREVDAQDLLLLREAVEPLLDAPTTTVREAAAWALAQSPKSI